MRTAELNFIGHYIYIIIIIIIPYGINVAQYLQYSDNLLVIPQYYSTSS